MDINAIEDNIKELEESATTFENVRELALLYIVRDNLKTGLKSVDNGKILGEYNDILPQYNKYVEIKRKYQLGQVDSKQVEKAIKLVCIEIKEFLYTLYSCTDMVKERECIRSMVENINFL